MKTYWFTVAVGKKYRAQARDLAASAAQHGIKIDVLDGKVRRKIHKHPKSLKIQGILDAPAWAERIVYLDSDTLILDPTYHDCQWGAVFETWTRPDSRLVGSAKAVKAYDVMVRKLYPEFANSHARFHSWNSGVIMGDRAFMMTLANNWRVAWDRVLKVTGGKVHRDQASFRLAHHQTCNKAMKGFELARSWNWILKRWGVRADVNIIHAAGEPMGKGKWRAWLKLKKEVLSR